MQIEHITYSCDKCGKRLKTHSNSINIVTVLRDTGYWSRLHVKIKHCHGMHNDGKTDEAELCKPCTVELLTDALTRIKKGERTTAGSEEIEEGKWGK